MAFLSANSVTLAISILAFGGTWTYRTETSLKIKLARWNFYFFPLANASTFSSHLPIVLEI